VVSHRIEQLLRTELGRLTEPQQERVLNFARSLSAQPAGITGEEFLKHAGVLPPEDAAEIRAIIDREFGEIDPDGW
jgi:hypothetical protein